MRIILLNWSEGENDPFSYFNQQWEQEFVELGHTVDIIPLDHALCPTIKAMHATAPVDLVVTWQGLGSQIGDGIAGTTLWAQLQIPLVCVHGDHPCYNPSNHQQSSRHILHIYLVPEFARDANRLIAREWPGLFEEPPNISLVSREVPMHHGDFFVFPKNFSDPVDMRSRWKETYTEATYVLLCAGADAIEQAYRNGNRRDHHEVLLDLLHAPVAEAVRAGRADEAVANFVLGLGRELDRVHRNIASEFVLESLPDVPIHVYGRGWERFASRGNPNHTFYSFDRLSHGDLQFCSSYGIIDIAPLNGGLHDRTHRAMHNGSGFLISSAWRHDEPVHEEFADLFFSGDAFELSAKVAAVRNDPDAHRARTRMFAEVYDALFPMAQFVTRIRSYAAERGFALPR